MVKSSEIIEKKGHVRPRYVELPEGNVQPMIFWTCYVYMLYL